MEAAFLMARASAIAILADCFGAATCGFMLFRTVVTGVTTSAVGPERRKCPGDRLGIRCMTLGARQVTSVVLRLVGQRGVAIVRRRPCIRHVANIALQSSAEVVRILADGNGAVVTGRT